MMIIFLVRRLHCVDVKCGWRIAMVHWRLLYDDNILGEGDFIVSM